MTDGIQARLSHCCRDGGRCAVLLFAIAIRRKQARSNDVRTDWEDDGGEGSARCAAHDSVQAAIAKARPLIAGFSDSVETTPVGGYGLKTPMR
jgi:hypothetical protein